MQLFSEIVMIMPVRNVMRRDLEKTVSIPAEIHNKFIGIVCGWQGESAYSYEVDSRRDLECLPHR